jgi:O-antigen/teichoic acid export membrane protein
MEFPPAWFNGVMLKLPDAIAGLLPKHILGPGLISLIIKLAGAVLAYGMVVAFARFLSTEEYGRFAFGLNLAIIAAAIGGFGFSTGIMRYWPKYAVAKDGAGARGVVRLGYLACALGGIAMIGIAFAVTIFSNVFSVFELFAIAVLGLMISFGDYSTNLLRAQGSTLVSMLPRDVLWRILSVIVAGFVVWFGVVVSGPLALIICAAVLAMLTLWQILNVKIHMTNDIVGAGSRNDWRQLRPSLLPLWASSVVFAMIQQFDVVIVGSLLGNADAGAYFAAQKTATLLSLVLIAAGLVAAPTMAALYHSGKRTELQALCRNLAAVIAAVTIVGFIMLIFVGQQLLAFFDPQFVSAYPILLIVAVGTMVDAIAGPNAYLMQMTSYERPYLRIMAVCYVLVLIAQFILVPLYGSIGAAIASTGGVVLWNVWAIVLLRREAGLDPSLLSLFLPPQQSVK